MRYISVPVADGDVHVGFEFLVEAVVTPPSSQDFFRYYQANSQGVALVNNVDQQSFQYSSVAADPQSFSYTVIGLVAGK